MRGQLRAKVREMLISTPLTAYAYLMRKIFRPNTLLCFSPPVMVATIIIELGFALLVLARYALTSARRIIIAILICLAAFQLAEFNVCGASPSQLIWSRIGYVFITLLPPLGLHLILKLRSRRQPVLIGAGYTVAIGFAAAFVFLPSSLNAGVCTGNYVIFLLAQPLSTLYGLYYSSLVGLGLVLSLIPVGSHNSRQAAALRWTAIGYLAFSAPTLIINYLLPTIHLGIPSIMCGFAVIFAIILGLRVAPLATD